MRLLSLLLPACLLALSGAASARTLPYPQVDDTAGTSTVQVRAPAGATAYITPYQANQISGSYAMSNGWHMKVETLSGRYITARIDNEKPMRLRAVGEGKFASRDGNVTMEFIDDQFGTDVTMSYVPDARLAQVVTITSRIAQR